MGTAPIPGKNETRLELCMMRRLPLSDDAWSQSLKDISPEEESSCSQRLMLAVLTMEEFFDEDRRDDRLIESPCRLRCVLIGNRELFWPEGIKPKPRTYVLEASNMLGNVALTWCWNGAAFWFQVVGRQPQFDCELHWSWNGSRFLSKNSLARCNECVGRTSGQIMSRLTRL